MQPLTAWLKAKLADTQLMALLTSLLVIFALLMLFGHILAPLLVAIALAYVLDDVVMLLERLRMPRLIAIAIVGSGGVLLIMLALLSIVPLLVQQLGRLVAQLPSFVAHAREGLQVLHAHYGSWIDPAYAQELLARLAGLLQEWGARLLSVSIASIPGLITLLVYAVLVPVLVFFLLKDKQILIAWSQRFLPRDRSLLARVWREVDVQIGNYIRGKFWENLIVAVVTWFAFWVFGHEYALLLAVLTGISVWVPFVGAAVVTVPVVLLSFFQWGWSDTAFYVLLAYTVIQILDGNVLVPWLFSEMVNLHPIAIVVAVLIFGSLWGLIGVFLAIPLAALVQSVLTVARERAT